MEGIIVIISIVLAYLLYQLYKGQRAEKETERERVIASQEVEEKKETGNMEEEKIATKDLLCKLLSEMDCNPEEVEDERVRFEYQGVVFLAEALNERLFVNFIWPWCHSISIFDIDEFARVRKVVNDLNHYGLCSVFYVPNKETDEIGVHMKRRFILASQIPQLNDYIRAIFRDFFTVQRELSVRIEVERLQGVPT